MLKGYCVKFQHGEDNESLKQSRGFIDGHKLKQFIFKGIKITYNDFDA